MIVTLRKDELLEACLVGSMRRIKNLSKAEAWGVPEWDGFGRDIQGALAEMAVAKYLGRYWHAIGDTPQSLPGDVGEGIQVRATHHQNGCLLVHPKDKDDDVFVFVVTSPPTFQLVGWLPAMAGKGDEYWRRPRTDRAAAFFVPSAALNPITTLKAAVYASALRDIEALP